MKRLVLSLWLTLAPAAGALAQDPAPATDPSADRSATFRAVDGAVAEDVPGGPLLVGAYGSALVLVAAYVLWLGRLQAGSSRELARLAAVLDKSERTPAIEKRDLPSSRPPPAKDASTEASKDAADADASAKAE